jgi:hypothetical protein
MSEQKKGSPLTAPEIEAIRDKSTCIMLETATAEAMTQSRGFIDVNPNNCWADWHRLRVQMTGKGYLPKIVLCVPGDKYLRERCEPILRSEKIEHEFRSHDEKMLQAFQASSMTWPSFTPQDYARIEGHRIVLYVLSENLVAAGAPVVGRAFLNLGRRLLDAGGIAIKCESSGISHSRTRWSGFDDKADRNAVDKWSALFQAYVVYPIASKTDMYTCGMHLLGAPDLIISLPTIQNLVKAGESDASATAWFFRTFAMYLLSECPVGNFASGHTFRVDQESPRYRVIWEPCAGFAEDNLFFNPFGRWRFTVA